MKHLLLLPPILAMLLHGVGVMPATAQSPAACKYVLGFQTLHDLIPSTVGNCADDQASGTNGDAQQHSTNGLLAWRKADNWTAFTDGYQTWINGPSGVQQRLNTQRYSWEADANAPGMAIVGAAPTSAPTSASVQPSGPVLTAAGCQTNVQAPSSFNGATFVYGANGFTVDVPSGWCVLAPITTYVDRINLTPGAAVLLGPHLGEQITIALTGRDGEDGSNKAEAYFSNGGKTGVGYTIAGLAGWGNPGGFSGPNAHCAGGYTSFPVCVPNQWNVITYMPWKASDTTQQLAIVESATPDTKQVTSAIIASARFVR